MGSSPRVRGKPPELAPWNISRRLIPACAGKTLRDGGASRRRRAHPRVCGENDGGIWGAITGGGSSPRVRGKPLDELARISDARLIPACAGKTWATGWFVVDERAHPRVCGENLRLYGLGALREGSSPRVRGKPAPGRPLGPQEQLIPACAGKTSTSPAGTPECGAHPRVCGENYEHAGELTDFTGSSPRVRGKLQVVPDIRLVVGLIPACAGKTRCCASWSTATRAHPRVCGENRHTNCVAGPRFGSSPRVRGKQGGAHGGHALNGLIPACAGKTAVAATASSAHRAHPRACGENARDLDLHYSLQGSSPRVRGKSEHLEGADQRGRLIPARAGKTSAAWAVDRSPGAHPRACGENQDPSPGAPGARGSSPRVRGKPGPGPRQGEHRGLIPARAGKTARFCEVVDGRSAHPRACGENHASAAAWPAWRGSSPRVRGKRSTCSCPPAGRGLIPARAGKTPASPSAAWRRSAHPRACGENRPRDSHGGHYCGSSPRVRGKHVEAALAAPRARLIPARAGKTSAPVRSMTSARAHPRACGENHRRAARNGVAGGSSPRVRGKQHGRPGREPGDRLIPARAGKTSGRRRGRSQRQAHPRACGENPGPLKHRPPGLGSSPRVRGKREARRR